MRYELQHHGIEGQKWGVRNGPPYPLEKTSKPKIAKPTLADRRWDLETKIVAKVSDAVDKRKTNKHQSDVKAKTRTGFDYIKNFLFFNQIINQENMRIFNENMRIFNEQALNQHMMDVMNHTYMHMF